MIANQTTLHKRRNDTEIALFNHIFRLAVYRRKKPSMKSPDAHYFYIRLIYGTRYNKFEIKIKQKRS